MAVTNVKNKVAFTLNGILGSSLLFAMSQTMLEYFLVQHSDGNRLYVSPEGYLYAGESKHSATDSPVVYIMTEDAEFIWEPKGTSTVTPHPQDDQSEFPF